MDLCKKILSYRKLVQSTAFIIFIIKVKFTLEETMKALRRNRGIAVLFT